MKKMINRDNIFTFIFILITFILISPLLQVGMNILGHDTIFHVSNILAIKEKLFTGDWFLPKIYPIIANGFGYGTGIFYGPLTHYVLALIDYFLVKFSAMTVIKIISCITIFLSMLFMYKFVYKITNKKYISLLSGVLYVTFPYFLSDIYVRNALAESMTFMFLPLIFNGLYELVYLNDSNKFYKLFIPGVVCLTLTHNITTFFTALFIILFLLLNIKKILNKNIIKPLIIALFFAICMCSFYLVPIIEQKVFADINIFNENTIASAQSVAYNALNISKLFPYKNNQSFDGIQFFILIPMLFLLFLSCLKYSEYKNSNKKIFLDFAIIGFIALFMTTNIFPWEYMPSFLLFIQFPWRLLVFADFFLSIFSIVCLLDNKNISEKMSCLLVSSLLLLNLIPLINLDRLANYGEDLVDISSSGIGAINDYLPSKVVQNYTYYENRGNDIVILEGEGNIDIIDYNAPYLKFNVSIESDKMVIELPLFYYYGYNVISQSDYYLSDNDKSKDEEIIIEESENGFVQLTINKSKYYIVNYTGSAFYKLSLYLSLFSFIIFLIFINTRSEKNEK